ncbi:NAD-dependent epimerase/dehydratase family protein [Microbacterium sp. NPDC057650]|uniref:NAD-dependent epimerase/dehydratase family protein n=1 Tax=unclassified Microbacterium TaxID=2609290 RepID=UPI0036729509
MTASLAEITAAVFGVSILAPFVFRPILRRWGVVDQPNQRSSHTTDTLRAGGLAPLTGWIVGGTITASVLPEDAAFVTIAVATAVALALLGLIDDLKTLPAAPRLGAQVVIGVGAAIAGATVVGVSPWWAVPLGSLLIVGYVNSANFMDGINALSSLHGMVVGCAFVAAGTLTGTTWLSALGAVIAAAFFAFLPWNLRTPGLFLGDVGSYLLGGSVAVVAMLALYVGVPALLILPPLAVHISDTATTVLRRTMRGERVTAPHRTHAYQRLLDTGLSHISAAILVTLFAIVNTGVGVAVWSAGWPPWIGWATVLVVCVIYLWIPRWRGSRLSETTLIVPLAPEVRDASASPSLGAERWAVVGASGFVGSAVVVHLRAIGVEVVEIPAPRLAVDFAVAADPEAIVDVARRHVETPLLANSLAGADVVVNAAGMAAPDSAASRELYGANTLLPAVVASAACEVGVSRLIHLSSAAVQGRRDRIDAGVEVAPFSAYSHSKALGERALLRHAAQLETNTVVILRATSVQGPGRATTERLIRLARSPLASVAAPGTAPSITSSITGLVVTIADLGDLTSAVPGLVLQPWEGLTTSRVLEAAAPEHKAAILPRWLCRFSVITGFAVSKVVPRFTGLTRRVEVMWFGQSQQPGWQQPEVVEESAELLRILGGGR